jgi:hypothetical protein
MRGISSPAENQLASQEGLRSMELLVVSWLVNFWGSIFALNSGFLCLYTSLFLPFHKTFFFLPLHIKVWFELPRCTKRLKPGVLGSLLLLIFPLLLSSNTGCSFLSFWWRRLFFPSVAVAWAARYCRVLCSRVPLALWNCARQVPRGHRSCLLTFHLRWLSSPSARLNTP